MRQREISLIDIRNRVQSISRLTTLPQIATRVLELVENPRTSASRLGEIISADQVLTARILKLANSAFYGFPRRISTLNLAIVVLGFNALRDLVLSISVIDRFNRNFNGDIHLEKFWRHAVVVAMGSRMLSRMVRYSVAGEVFVGGLLHDIGYLVLVQHFPSLFERVMKYAREKQVPFLQAEYSVLGFSHAEIGSWLAEGWNLPEKLVQAIRFHHQPPETLKYREFVWSIHLADLISHSIDEGGGLNQLPEYADVDIEERLKHLFKQPQPLEYYQDAFRRENEKVDDFLATLLNRKVNEASTVT